jgi:hypothetical protein
MRRASRAAVDAGKTPGPLVDESFGVPGVDGSGERFGARREELSPFVAHRAGKLACRQPAAGHPGLFEDGHVVSQRRQTRRRRQTGHAGADHDGAHAAGGYGAPAGRGASTRGPWRAIGLGRS